MKGSRFTTEQIIMKLREAEIHISQGKTVSEAARQIGISYQTFFKWRSKYANMTTSNAKYSMTLEAFINELEEDREFAEAKYRYECIEITGKAYKGYFSEDYVMMSILDNGYGSKINVYFQEPSIINTIVNKSVITIRGLYISKKYFSDWYDFKHSRLLDS